MNEVAFLLVPNFSMIALYGALEPLRVANRFAGSVFSWHFLSADGRPVAASNGIPVSVSGPFESAGRPDLALVCASYEPERGMDRALLGLLRRLARKGVALGGMDTGPFLLAAAGVLDGHRATCHWESLPGFRESYPAVEARRGLFEIDRGRLTCAGGAAAIDMMLAHIEALHGRKLAVMVADQLVHFRVAQPVEEARVPASARYPTRDPRLIRAIEAMEENIEEPLPSARLAALAGLSQRQFERLFQASFGETPKGFYLRLRLERAERLINYAALPMRDVALAAGFSSLAQFSRSFRARYGVAPSRFSGKPLERDAGIG